MALSFQPLQIGDFEIKHRIALAPLTRLRATKKHVPTKLQAEYYRQRSLIPGTLIVTEGTIMAPYAGGIPNAPGVWSSEQVEAWKPIVKLVHDNSSHIFNQLWSYGRGADLSVIEGDGATSGVVGPSAIPISDKDATPRALTEAEIQQYVKDYAKAAKNSMEAGFDGVELHLANGYLLDEFIQSNSNHRDDKYGGSISNRARFPLEVVKAVIDAVGDSKKVAVRLSPWSEYQAMRMPDPIPQFSYMAEQLKPLGLAYLSLVLPRFNGSIECDATDNNEGDSNSFIYDIWGRTSPIMVAGNLSPEDAETLHKKHKDLDLITAFGRHFLSNPDLPFRIARGLSLNKYDRKTFYVPEQKEGYDDYPFSQEWKDLVKDSEKGLKYEDFVPHRATAAAHV